MANISTPPEDEAILLDPKLNALFSIHKRFSKLEPDVREPKSRHAAKKAEEVKDFIGAYQAYHNDDAAQLFAILNKPHIKVRSLRNEKAGACGGRGFLEYIS